MTGFTIYIAIAVVFGAVYGFQYMKPHFAQATRPATFQARIILSGKLGVAFAIAWAGYAVLMPLAIGEGLYNAIKKYNLKRKTTR